ncbi:DUF3368 domain-containing protein [uncultured Mucilaginibacter sp.]|uniref:DUF3368 domain-containing protein n=1 Tax=uncultured Mucilaginibacter sp. TaxID=797541 RepID=UPI0025FDCD6E|nr:DUF3368 domain-containing protein [uncultured Mucilaginibacter sp.]
MVNNIIISDASCLIALDRIHRLDILHKTFSTIFTTSKVQEEFGRLLPEWIVIKAVSNQEQLQQLEQLLDPGEASAITLALETYDPILIIDEKKGRKIAVGLNLNIIGTLKVLLMAKQAGVIPLVKPLIELLDKRSFRFSKVVTDEILELANEMGD